MLKCFYTYFSNDIINIFCWATFILAFRNNGVGIGPTVSLLSIMLIYSIYNMKEFFIGHDKGTFYKIYYMYIQTFYIPLIIHLLMIIFNSTTLLIIYYIIYVLCALVIINTYNKLTELMEGGIYSGKK